MMYDTALLGDLVVPACDDCHPEPGHLCAHDHQILPLAEAIARGFGATTDHPRTGAFLIDADALYNTIGPGPYETTELDVDAPPHTAPGDEQPYCAALLINRWVVAFPTADSTDAPPVVVCRLPEHVAVPARDGGSC